MDEMTLTLNSPITEEQWDAITDVDFEHTNEITFHTKHGKIVKFVKASAQPERKKGEWIYGENDCQDGWFCSECDGFVPWDYDYYGLNNINFIADFKTCPFCDAKMVSYTGKDLREGETE